MVINKLTISMLIASLVMLSSCGSAENQAEVESPALETAEVKTYDCELKVVATGEKNELAESAEVWILEINTDVDSTVNVVERAMIDSNWKQSGERMVAVNWPASINYSVKANELLNLRLYKHTWSGKAKVYLNNKLVEELDLYSTDTTLNYIDIAINPSDYCE